MAEQKKRGRPSRPIDLEQVHELAREGASVKEIADSQGRKKQGHWAAIAKKNEEVNAAVTAGRDELKRNHEQRVIPAAQAALINLVLDPSHSGHTAAVIFVHKAMLNYREGVKHEVSGEIQHLHSLSPEQRLEKIKALQKELTEAVDVQLIPEDKDDSSGT